MLPEPIVLSVVIPAYNCASVLPRILDALQQQMLSPGSFETIVVDDGSTDDTEAIVSGLSLPSAFRYIRQNNKGAAAARNHGALLARGKHLLFIDSDVVPDPNLLDAHLMCQQAHQRTLVVGRTRIWPGYQNVIFYRHLGREIFAFDFGDQETPIGYQDVVSRNFSLTREAFFEIGAFDEAFARSGYEDTEFAFRAYQLGYQFIYSPTASGTHHHTGTLSQVGEHMYYYQIAAALFISKHPEAAGQIRHLRDKEPIRVSHDSPKLLTRKLVRRILSMTICQTLLRKMIAVLEIRRPESTYLRILYWQVLGSYLFHGFREGLRLYNVYPTDFREQ